MHVWGQGKKEGQSVFFLFFVFFKNGLPIRQTARRQERGDRLACRINVPTTGVRTIV